MVSGCESGHFVRMRVPARRQKEGDFQSFAELKTRIKHEREFL
jgi:hypothetical protein